MAKQNKEQEFVPEYFSALNWKEAKKLIGKTVEGCDKPGSSHPNWAKTTLQGFSQNTLYPFIVNHPEDRLAFIRTIPETYNQSTKRLLKVLDMSIRQWKLMIETEKISFEEKKECAEFLAGKTISNSCFLCEEFFIDDCKGCLSWNSPNITRIKCQENASPYEAWRQFQTKEHAIKVLEYLKSEWKHLTGTAWSLDAYKQITNKGESSCPE